MTFARKVSVTLATRIALILVGIVTSIIMARALGPEGKGLFSLAVVSVGLVFIVVNLGVGAASGFMLGRRKTSLEELAGNWLSLSVLIGVAALALSLAVASPLAPRWLPSVPFWALAIALCALPFSILAYNFQMLFRANDDFRNYNIIEALQPVSFLVALASLAFLPSQLLLGASLVGYLVSTAVTGLGAALLMGKFVKLSLRWNGDVVARALRFGVQHSFGNLLDVLNFRIDVLLVNYFLDPAHVGYYSISVLLAEKLWYVPNVLSTVLHPRVAHAGDEGDANRDTALVSRITVLVVAAGCVAILLLGRPVVRLFYADRFLPAVTPLFLLLPGIFMISLSKILQSDLTARGYPRANVWAGLIAVASNVVLNVLLIPRIGIEGAAIASTVSYSLYALVMAVYFMRVTGVALAAIVVPKAGDVRYLVEKIKGELSRMRSVRQP